MTKSKGDQPLILATVFTLCLKAFVFGQEVQTSQMIKDAIHYNYSRLNGLEATIKRTIERHGWTGKKQRKLPNGTLITEDRDAFEQLMEKITIVGDDLRYEVWKDGLTPERIILFEKGIARDLNKAANLLSIRPVSDQVGDVLFTDPRDGQLTKTFPPILTQLQQEKIRNQENVKNQVGDELIRLEIIHLKNNQHVIVDFAVKYGLLPATILYLHPDDSVGMVTEISYAPIGSTNVWFPKRAVETRLSKDLLSTKSYWSNGLADVAWVEKHTRETIEVKEGGIIDTTIVIGKNTRVSDSIRHKSYVIGREESPSHWPWYAFLAIVVISVFLAAVWLKRRRTPSSPLK